MAGGHVQSFASCSKKLKKLHWYHLGCGMSRHPFIMSWSNRPLLAIKDLPARHLMLTILDALLCCPGLAHISLWLVDGSQWRSNLRHQQVFKNTMTSNYIPVRSVTHAKTIKNLKSPNATLSFKGTFQSPSSLPSLYSLKIGSLKSLKGPALALPCHWNYGSAKTAKKSQRGSTGSADLGSSGMLGAIKTMAV